MLIPGRSWLVFIVWPSFVNTTLSQLQLIDVLYVRLTETEAPGEVVVIVVGHPVPLVTESSERDDGYRTAYRCRGRTAGR